MPRHQLAQLQIFFFFSPFFGICIVGVKLFVRKSEGNQQQVLQAISTTISQRKRDVYEKKNDLDGNIHFKFEVYICQNTINSISFHSQLKIVISIQLLILKLQLNNIIIFVFIFYSFLFIITIPQFQPNMPLLAITYPEPP